MPDAPVGMRQVAWLLTSAHIFSDSPARCVLRCPLLYLLSARDCCMLSAYASASFQFCTCPQVVTKLFHIVEPDAAFFGRKDYQQWRVIERMVRDLDMAVRVVGMPIQREADGLAMSRCEPSSGGGSTAFACD